MPGRRRPGAAATAAARATTASSTDYGDFSYAFAYAVAGVPVAVVPAGAERGLPVGVQVLAAAFKRPVALAAARALEGTLGDVLPPLPSLAAPA